MPKIAVVGSFVVGLTVRVPRMPVLGEGLIGDLFDMEASVKQVVAVMAKGGGYIAAPSHTIILPEANQKTMLEAIVT